MSVPYSKLYWSRKAIKQNKKTQKTARKGSFLQNVVGLQELEPRASCSQSRRATNCATPGYEIFQLWSNMGATLDFDQLPVSGTPIILSVSNLSGILEKRGSHRSHAFKTIVLPTTLVYHLLNSIILHHDCYGGCCSPYTASYPDASTSSKTLTLCTFPSPLR